MVLVGVYLPERRPEAAARGATGAVIGYFGGAAVDRAVGALSAFVARPAAAAAAAASDLSLAVAETRRALFEFGGGGGGGGGDCNLNGPEQQGLPACPPASLQLYQATAKFLRTAASVRSRGAS